MKFFSGAGFILFARDGITDDCPSSTSLIISRFVGDTLLCLYFINEAGN